MGNRNQRKGIRYEHEVVNMFKDAGYNAQRTAGSHSEFDVIVWKKDRSLNKICFIVFIQCKTKKDKIAPAVGLSQTDK